MSLSLIAKQQPQAITKLYSLKHEVFQEGALTAKEKELIAVSLSCVLKCDTCLETHVKAAKDLGATTDELREAMLVAMYLAGPSAVVWSPKVDEALQDGNE
jgi:AhpD family alkylhydroperoxidase